MVHDNDAWWDMKQRGFQRPASGFLAVHMPKNTPAGLVLAALSTFCGFALIWHVWWLVVASLLGIVAYAIYHSFNYDRDFHIPAATVAATEQARSEQLKAAHV